MLPATSSLALRCHPGIKAFPDSLCRLDIASVIHRRMVEDEVRERNESDKPSGKGRKPYDHRVVEKKWQVRWEAAKIHEVDLAHARRPYSNLMMFPYPSSEGLHVGNVYAFTGADIHGRFMAMQGYDMFEPMGFDAFGIHGENYAIKIGVHPKRLTARNVERFRETQLKRIGNRFDWSHEVHTSEEGYYNMDPMDLCATL